MKTAVEILIATAFPVWIMFFPPKNTLVGYATATTVFIVGALALVAIVNS